MTRIRGEFWFKNELIDCFPTTQRLNLLFRLISSRYRIKLFQELIETLSTILRTFRAKWRSTSRRCRVHNSIRLIESSPQLILSKESSISSPLLTTWTLGRIPDSIHNQDSWRQRILKFSLDHPRKGYLSSFQTIKVTYKLALTRTPQDRQWPSVTLS